MRQALIAALRGYWPDADDAVDDPLLLGRPDEPQSLNAERFTRLMLRALREVEQDRRADRQAAQAAIQDLRQRVAALEAKLP